ncbi:hypothetical protein CDD80_196 [Ophiocordyceps camponoti-rufipedis]|uniref:Uncharacterized protein n=1 Tax=Ophiocordyceps camponoti-rufipedis TaxID=2004952 RepID=A0A2C5YL22_9HYPO|nr:hypothetical protein CDD80_196 [Ophiocordyceps camponoti-rufipedis]
MPTSTSVNVSVGSESESVAPPVVSTCSAPADAVMDSSRSQTKPLIQPDDIQRWIDGSGASVVDLALLFPPLPETGRRQGSGGRRRRREAAL